MEKLTGPNVGSCWQCGDPVEWVKTVAGKNQPLELEPSRSPLEGNVFLIDGVSHYVTDERRIELLTQGEPVRIAHFAKCKGRVMSGNSWTSGRTTFYCLNPALVFVLEEHLKQTCPPFTVRTKTGDEFQADSARIDAEGYVTFAGDGFVRARAGEDFYLGKTLHHTEIESLKVLTAR